MTAEKTMPSLGEVALTIFAVLLAWRAGEAWLTNLFRVLTALWLASYAYPAIRKYLTKEPS